MPTRCNRWYFLQILLHAQHVSGNTMPIIRSSRVLYRWSLPVVFGALVFRLSVWCGAGGYVSGLQAAALAACWACNKICNKYNLLHLVGILFPRRIQWFSTRRYRKQTLRQLQNKRILLWQWNERPNRRIAQLTNKTNEDWAKATRHMKPTDTGRPHYMTWQGKDRNDTQHCWTRQ